MRYLKVVRIIRAGEAIYPLEGHNEKHLNEAISNAKMMPHERDKGKQKDKFIFHAIKSKFAYWNTPSYELKERYMYCLL